MTDDSAKSPTPEQSEALSPESDAPDSTAPEPTALETEGAESSAPENLDSENLDPGNQNAEPATSEASEEPSDVASAHPSDDGSEVSADDSLESPDVSEALAETAEESSESENADSSDETLTNTEATQADDAESTAETESAETESAESTVSASQPEAKEPEAKEPEASTSAPEPDPVAASSTSSGTLNKVLSLAKGGTVWTLQTSVRALNWTVLKLEDAKSRSENRETKPSGGEWVERLWVTVQPLMLFVSLTTTRSLNAVLTWSLKTLDADAVPTSTSVVETEVANTTLFTKLSTAIAQTLTPILTQLWRLWLRLLAILRDRLLPESLKTLSDITLTTFATLLLVGILWLTSAITSGGTPATAQERPADATPAMTAPPSSSKPVPNPKRLTVIQEKVSALTDEYAEGMVQSVQVNFGGDRLIVTLGPDWYRLDEAQQDQLAQNLLAKTKTLDFSKLDMIDFSGTRIGRNPVVGDDMIIFSRTKELPPVEPEEIEPEEVKTEPESPSASFNESDEESEPASERPELDSEGDSANDSALEEFEKSTELADDLAAEMTETEPLAD